VAAWKEMEPLVRATTYRTDSRAEVLYDALEVRDALNNTRSLQDRARTAHHAVEAHVERCAAAVEKALAIPIATHRASPGALRATGHITRAGSMVASVAGIQPVAKTLNWASQNLQQSAASAAHVREFGGVERTAKDMETTRHLVRAALDLAYAKTQEALISKNEEQFSFVRVTITPKQHSQYNSLREDPPAPVYGVQQCERGLVERQCVRRQFHCPRIGSRVCHQIGAASLRR